MDGSVRTECNSDVEWLQDPVNNLINTVFPTPDEDPLLTVVLLTHNYFAQVMQLAFEPLVPKYMEVVQIVKMCC